MTTPAAAANTGIGATAGGGLLSAVGSIFSGISQKNMYDYQAQVSRINSQIDQQNSEYSLNQGEQQATITGLKGAQQFGAIRAAQGASNIDVNSGSTVNVQNSQKQITAMDLTTIRQNAAKTAYDWQVKSTSDLNQAGLYDKAGSNAETAGFLGAASSILGTVGSVSSKWLQASTAGIYGSTSGGTRETMGLDNIYAVR